MRVPLRACKRDYAPHPVLAVQFESIHIPTMMITITPAQLRKAADIQENIQSLQAELRQLLGGETFTPAGPIEAAKKRRFTAATRAKIRAAQKARWARIKGTVTATKPEHKSKRKMSAEGLANIRAGVAKRMAAQSKKMEAKSVKKARKKISAAGLANIRAAQKARWAQAKAAKLAQV